MHSTGLHGAKFVPQGGKWGQRGRVAGYRAAGVVGVIPHILTELPAAAAAATTAARHQFDLNA